MIGQMNPEPGEVIDVFDVVAVVSEFVDVPIHKVLIDEVTVAHSARVTNERRTSSAAARPWCVSTRRISSGFPW